MFCTKSWVMSSSRCQAPLSMRLMVRVPYSPGFGPNRRPRAILRLFSSGMVSGNCARSVSVCRFTKFWSAGSSSSATRAIDTNDTVQHALKVGTLR